MGKIDDTRLLYELEDLMRTMPPVERLTHDSPDVLEWCGRASATVEQLGPLIAGKFSGAVDHLGRHGLQAGAKRDIPLLLHRARHTVRLRTAGPLSESMPAGGVFDYYDHVRKIIEGAATDLLFVDPFLDGAFVGRYIPHVRPGVTVRLLTLKGVPTILPGAALLMQQQAVTIQVRTSPTDMHDRYLFVDGTSGYQSGASFKDGAMKAPTTVTQITDALIAVQQEYESRWATGKIYL